MERPRQRSHAVQSISSTLREQEIVETVFRHQIKRCYEDVAHKVYFLSYQKADPTNELMKRFRDYGTLVRKRSDMAGFYKQRSGDLSVLLSVARIESINDLNITVSGSCSTGVLVGSAYLYRLEKKGGRWRVRSQRLTGFA
jgi:hypothetical protein